MIFPTMNKKFLLGLMVAVASGTAQAQDTYLNDRATNTSDVIGSARYVGMGGALGALGADISVISNNPAGIGLIRKPNVSFTLGGQIQDAAPANGDSRGVFTFDQMGFVIPFNGSNGSRFNFSFNYQKKANYNHSIFASQNLGGLSQSDMFAWVANSTAQVDDKGFYYFTSPFYDNLYLAGFFGEYLDADGNEYFRNLNRGYQGNYYRNTWGGLYGFDINLSGSIGERYYLGFTLGIDRLNYHQSAYYEEVGDDSYVLYQDQKLDGTGVNIKVGGIIRPIEDNPFRFGVTIETPTWFTLRHNGWAGVSVLNSSGVYSKPTYMDDDNFLEYKIYSPWKFRASVGTTFGSFMAMDVEYEYCMNNYTKMGYPDTYNNAYYGVGPRSSMIKDVAMNELTQAMTRGVHNIRAGVEIRPLSPLALRAGYNFFSAPFQNNARLDQTTNSNAFDWSTSTEYINLGPTHIVTLGLGYQGKHLYADIAYKYRMQRGDYYSFDDNFSSYNESFIKDNPLLANQQLRATKLNLDRHNIAVTIGCKF